MIGNPERPKKDYSDLRTVFEDDPRLHPLEKDSEAAEVVRDIEFDYVRFMLRNVAEKAGVDNSGTPRTDGRYRSGRSGVRSIFAGNADHCHQRRSYQGNNPAL